jgi:hypothetical protein
MYNTIRVYVMYSFYKGAQRTIITWHCQMRYAFCGGLGGEKMTDEKGDALLEAKLNLISLDAPLLFGFRKPLTNIWGRRRK